MNVKHRLSTACTIGTRVQSHRGKRQNIYPTLNFFFNTGHINNVYIVTLNKYH